MTSDDMSPDDVVRIENVSREFRRRRTSPFTPPSTVLALDAVTLNIPRGARFGIVGESGSGKTTLVRLIAALDQPTTGRVIVDDIDISALREPQLRPLRRRLQLVFQDPMGSLDPRMRIEDVVAEPLLVRRRESSTEPLLARRRGAVDVQGRVLEVLTAVGLDRSALRRYPHQFSGGQRQRISIARAIAPRPSILLADEAVSALDVSTRGQILELLEQLALSEDFTLVFVSHDLSVIRRTCDRVAVLRHGQVVESGLTTEVYAHPRHPYTRELLAAVPTIERGLASARARAAGSEE